MSLVKPAISNTRYGRTGTTIERESKWLTERTDLMISSGSCAHDLFVSLPFNSIGDVEGASL